MKKKVLETNNWKFKGEEITLLSQCPENAYGFIYVITNNLTGEKYIGKKCLYSFHKVISRVPGKGSRTRKQIDIVKTESDWQRYWGSDIEFKKQIKTLGKENFQKEILYFVNSKAELTYYETKELFTRGVLEPGSMYANDNILGKFYKKIFNQNVAEKQEEETGSSLKM